MLAVLTVASIQTVIPEGIAYGQIENNPKVVEVANTSSIALNTEQIVRSYFKDIPIMIEIARCESGFRHTLANGNVLQGIVDNDDTGVMQINKRYHNDRAITMNLDLNDLYQNMTYARFLYETQGTRPWNASAFCWNNSVASKI